MRLSWCVVFVVFCGPVINGKTRKRLETKYDAASQQLELWQVTHKIKTATAEQGYPVPSLTATLGIGRHGPLLLQDLNFADHIASFVSERIPERVVHAKAAGAFGYFVATNPDIFKYTKANVFRFGEKTRVVARLSTVIGELGSADSVNDIRGFSVKFKTQDGNYDLVMLSVPVFNVREPLLFPSFMRSRKRNPSTHVHDPNILWDFRSARPESTFNAFLGSSDFGFPKNYRHMSAFSINAFKFTGGREGSAEPVFVKFHMISNQRKAISSPETYVQDAGRDPDSFIRDLYNAIEDGNYPTWTLNVQIVTMAQIKKFKFDPFDSTKTWPQEDYPLTSIGTLVLNQNPKDYFNDVEQIGFNPANLVPGIEISPDRLLHGRVFMYSVAQRYRLGKNFHQLPVNRPQDIDKVHAYTRDGFASIYGNADGGPNYYPNTFNGPVPTDYAQASVFPVEDGDVVRFDVGEIDNYFQVDNYFRTSMEPDERNRTLKVIAQSLALASSRIQTRALERNWDPVSPEFSRLLRAELAIANADRRKARKNRY